MRPASALVFDLDGTIADTRLDIATACNHALVSVGQPSQSVEAISACVGNGAHALVAGVLGLTLGDARTLKALESFNRYYAEHAADQTALMPGAQRALDACSRLPLALATNKPRAITLRVLEALGLTQRFWVVIAGGDGPLKPDPAAILSALGPLRIRATDAWVVGDGPQDVGAGKSAGAWTVAVLGGFAPESDLRKAGPDRVIASLYALPDLMDEVLHDSANTVSTARTASAVR